MCFVFFFFFLFQRCVCILLVDVSLLKGRNLDHDESLQIEEEEMCGLANEADEADEDKKGSLSFQMQTSEKCCFKFNNNSNSSSPIELNSKNKSASNNYLGHFIVLIGYDDLRGCVFYRNPATSKKLSYTSYANIEIARKSYGTDQDILFIYL